MDYEEVANIANLPEGSYQIVQVQGTSIILFHYDGEVTALANKCLHKSGPLGKGVVKETAEGRFITCPWHGWEYNIKTGKAPAGFQDQQAVYDVQVKDDGKIWVSTEPSIEGLMVAHAENPLADLEELRYQTTPTSLNILGISCTNMNKELPRYSTSEAALEQALEMAQQDFGAETQLIRLRDLDFRPCEGYYSLHEEACTWPCSISEMDKEEDGMVQVYRAMILWADIVIIATPIRWGNASSLYYKMVERLNCVQNQITLFDKILIKNKVVGFIITGGQDNIQHVAGQMCWFFTDLGFIIPPFSFLGWSRGWIAEDMEQNTETFKTSGYIKRSLTQLIQNSVNLSQQIKHIDREHMHTSLPNIAEAPSKGHYSEGMFIEGAKEEQDGE
ncbi:MAG TPA: Rieske 2Fe-2S domain-containing protein [Candidatus Lokiarchaeia archaeon]|nr:Rieske 2Fe-2S domain-containing protein [Candidatus Lokiarchaeia archaeon]